MVTTRTIVQLKNGNYIHRWGFDALHPYDPIFTPTDDIHKAAEITLDQYHFNTFPLGSKLIEVRFTAEVVKTVSNLLCEILEKPNKKV